MSKKLKLLCWFLTLASVLFAWVLPQFVEMSKRASSFLDTASTVFARMILRFTWAWPLLLYALLCLLFFFWGYRFVLTRKRFWKLVLLPVPLLLFSLCFFSLKSHYEVKYIEHEYRGQENPLGCDLQEKVDAMRDLVDQYRPPCWLQELGVNKAREVGFRVFDVNSYFTVLTNLSVASGYVLDYVHIGGANGLPVIYTRRDSGPPISSFEELGQRYPEIDELDQGISREEWGKAIRINPTSAGYLEYAALYIIGEQFYLFWHANYNDRMVIASSKKLEEVINNGLDFDKMLPEDCRREAAKLDVRPVVEMGTDDVTVRLLTFSKWGGFERMNLVISRDPPYRISSEELEPLVEYDCGIIY